jgi:mitochondrial distribution and morphology protein 12
MSIDINWETITSGPDGEALAESIRSFVHDKFQQVALPGFIRSVQVRSFDFGKTCPQLEIKDIGDPLPDFYDDNGDGEADGPLPTGNDRYQNPGESRHAAMNEELSLDHAGIREGEVKTTSLYDISRSRALPPQIKTNHPASRSPFNLAEQLGSPFPRSGTPGIPGGTSNLSYFHLPLGGLSGTQTPLAAVASGTNFPAGTRSDFAHEPSYAANTNQTHAENGISSSTRPSTAASLITSQSNIPDSGLPPSSGSPILSSSTQMRGRSSPPGSNTNNTANARRLSSSSPSITGSQPTDLQVTTHVKYAGDIRLTLTAEILLNYPMPSFVGIPLKLSITGLTFDGVAVLASIKQNLHFCFLAPEDAEMLVGRSGGANVTSTDVEGGREGKETRKWKGTEEGKIGGLLEEIRVESEIGRKENGKQVLKNVGKVERFVLEQVRRIFTDEFVFPSFWTFLV